jgi:hypothetical protein
MKITASLLILLACAGCASPPQPVSVTYTLTNSTPMPPLPTVPVGTLISVVQHDLTTPATNAPQFIKLTWDENYVPGFTNEQTEIDESTDLVNWATCFTGATNECWIEEIYPYAFFRAKNFLP